MNRRAFLLLLSAGCAGRGGPRVAAAANLARVLPELFAAFPTTAFTFAASGVLFEQIQNGAGYDLFLSAEADFPRRLGDFFAFARGRLALVRRAGADASLGALADGRGRVVLANPRHAPYGKAAEETLAKLGLAAAYRERLLVAASAEQAAQMFDAGNADAAFLPLSTAIAMGDRVAYAVVPADHHAPLVHAGVALTPAGGPLKDALLSPAGRATLAKFGYEPPGA